MVDTIVRQDLQTYTISQTNGRYTLSKEEDQIWDNFLNKEVLPDDRGFYDIFPLGKVHFHELWLLINKPLYIDAVDFTRAWKNEEIEILRRDQISVNRWSLYWKFKLECRSFPNFYYVPGYTRYVINREGKVFSLIGSNFLTEYLNPAGYPAYRMFGDDGKEHHVTIHRILALTFFEWDVGISKMEIDHIDGNPLNYSLDNLEFVSNLENLTRATNSDHYGRGKFGKDKNDRVYCEDMVTKEVKLFETISAAVKHIGLNGNSLIYHHLRTPLTHSLVKQRYLVKRVKVDAHGKPVNLSINYDDIITRVGSQVRPVLSKNIDTGEIVLHESAIAFIEFSGLSRKQVYERLKQSNQKVFVNLIFKYEDDDTPWIV